jgi:hypothetical protein
MLAYSATSCGEWLAGKFMLEVRMIPVETQVDYEYIHRTMRRNLLSLIHPGMASLLLVNLKTPDVDIKSHI